MDTITARKLKILSGKKAHGITTVTGTNTARKLLLMAQKPLDRCPVIQVARLERGIFSLSKTAIPDCRLYATRRFPKSQIFLMNYELPVRVPQPGFPKTS
jgi:hypothetical protein